MVILILGQLNQAMHKVATYEDLKVKYKISYYHQTNIFLSHVAMVAQDEPTSFAK